jgi:hypothetical protein
MRIIRDLLGHRVRNVIIPIRNEVVHGRAFGRPANDYARDIYSAFVAVRDWLASVRAERRPDGYECSEVERWLLSMEHWVYWFDSKLQQHVPLDAQEKTQ